MPSLKAKTEDQEFNLQSIGSSSIEFDNVTYSQYDDTAEMKFATSTPTKIVSCDVSINTSDDVGLEIESKISTVSTVSTASSFSVELNSSKDISNNEWDNDIIEQLQIRKGRVWDRKYVAIANTYDTI